MIYPLNQWVKCQICHYGAWNLAWEHDKSSRSPCPPPKFRQIPCRPGSGRGNPTVYIKWGRFNAMTAQRSLKGELLTHFHKQPRWMPLIYHMFLCSDLLYAHSIASGSICRRLVIKSLGDRKSKGYRLICIRKWLRDIRLLGNTYCLEI